MTEIPAALAAELARLQAENARLLKMLELSPRQEAWYRWAIPLAEQRYEDYLKQEDIR